jgi:hypothetical protein
MEDGESQLIAQAKERLLDVKGLDADMTEAPECCKPSPKSFSLSGLIEQARAQRGACAAPCRCQPSFSNAAAAEAELDKLRPPHLVPEAPDASAVPCRGPNRSAASPARGTTIAEAFPLIQLRGTKCLMCHDTEGVYQSLALELRDGEKGITRTNVIATKCPSCDALSLDLNGARLILFCNAEVKRPDCCMLNQHPPAF